MLVKILGGALLVVGAYFAMQMLLGVLWAVLSVAVLGFLGFWMIEQISTPSGLSLAICKNLSSDSDKHFPNIPEPQMILCWSWPFSFPASLTIDSSKNNFIGVV